MCRAYERILSNQPTSAILRKRLNEIELDASGQLGVPTLSNKASVVAKILAVSAVASHGKGKLIRRAWMITGYASVEQMATTQC